MLSFHTCPLATLGGKDTGGMNVYVRELVRALGRRGVGVDVFTRSQDEHVPHVLHHLGYGKRVRACASRPESRPWTKVACPALCRLRTFRASASLRSEGPALRPDPQSLLAVGPGGPRGCAPNGRS
jgi:hypothetical protein